MSGLVKSCWHCGTPFYKDWLHPSGKQFDLCAGCYFPFDKERVDEAIEFFGGIATSPAERNHVAILRRTKIGMVR